MPPTPDNSKHKFMGLTGTDPLFVKLIKQGWYYELCSKGEDIEVDTIEEAIALGKIIDEIVVSHQLYINDKWTKRWGYPRIMPMLSQQIGKPIMWACIKQDGVIGLNTASDGFAKCDGQAADLNTCFIAINNWLSMLGEQPITLEGPDLIPNPNYKDRAIKPPSY